MQDTIFIRPDKDFYYSGENVTGHVYLNINQNFGSGMLTLRLRGVEISAWVEEHEIFEDPDGPRRQIPENEFFQSNQINFAYDSSDSDEEPLQNLNLLPTHRYYRNQAGQLYEIIWHNGRNFIMDVRIPLYQWTQGFIPAGQYIFPFCFATSVYWPGTFQLKHSRQRGRTKYEIKAICEFPANRRMSLRNKQELCLYQRPITTSSDIHQINAHIKSCCCLNKGEVSIKAQFEKNAYTINEQANLIAEIDLSRSQVNMNQLILSIVKRVTLQDNNGQILTFDENVASRNSSGLALGQQAVGANARRESIIVSQNGVTPTSSGKYVKCEYFLQVNCDMDASCMCCGDTPMVSNPILIYPLPRVVPQFQQPQNWQPQTLPIYNVVVPQAALPSQQNPYYNAGIQPTQTPMGPPPPAPAPYNQVAPQMNNNGPPPANYQNQAPPPGNQV